MRMHNPPHPGETLSEMWLLPLGLTVTHAAAEQLVEISENGRKVQVHCAGASNHLLTMAW